MLLIVELKEHCRAKVDGGEPLHLIVKIFGRNLLTEELQCSGVALLTLPLFVQIELEPFDIVRKVEELLLTFSMRM